MSLLTVFAEESTAESCKDHWYYVDYSGRQYQCFDNLRDAVADVKANETAEIVLVDGKTFNVTDNVLINRNVTINLNGQTVTFAGGSWTVKGVNVTVKNGTISTGYTSSIKVNAEEKATTLTFTNDVKVESASTAGHNVGAVVKVEDATKAAVVNINGEWDVKNELVDCDPGKNKNLTINLNAKVTADDLKTAALVSLDAGTTTVNVNGGSYTTNKYVFELTNGTLNVNGGDLESTANSTIVVEDPTGKYTNALNIKGGDVVSKAAYAIWFNGSKGTYKITDGTFTSAKNADDEQLPALYIRNINFLANHKNMITGGHFTGSIVGDVKEGTRITKAAAAQADLVGNATVSEKDGVVTVGGSHEENKKPSDPTEPAPNT